MAVALPIAPWRLSPSSITVQQTQGEISQVREAVCTSCADSDDAPSASGYFWSPSHGGESMRCVNARAIHIGADELVWPGHAHLCRLHSCRDTLARMTRLAHAAGIQEQHWLAGTQATCATMAETIKHGATALAPDRLLVVTFSGHTEWNHDQAFWCLHDSLFPLGEMAACLARCSRPGCDSAPLWWKRPAVPSLE
jgi:hypothetical protein